MTRAWRGEHVESLLGLSKEPVGVSVVTRPAESFGPARTLWPRSASTYPPIRPSISNGRKAQHEFHSHRYFELLVCPRGMWRLDFLGGSMEVAAGEVVVLTPFLTHGAAKAQTDPAGSPVWVVVDPPVLGIWNSEIFPHGRLFVRDERRTLLLETLCFELMESPPALHGAFGAVFLDVVRRCVEQGTPYEPDLGNRMDAVRLMKDFICEHLHDESLDLAAAAEAVGFSVPYAGRIFNEVTGQSFRLYLQCARLRRAQEMLVATDWTVQQVAESVGIPDPFYFSRLFKKNFGFSPTHYRAVRTGAGARARRHESS